MFLTKYRIIHTNHILHDYLTYVHMNSRLLKQIAFVMYTKFELNRKVKLKNRAPVYMVKNHFSLTKSLKNGI